MGKRIYLCLAHMSEAGLEQKYIKEAFDTNWVVPLGPNVNAFEDDLKKYVGEGCEGCVGAALRRADLRKRTEPVGFPMALTGTGG